MRLINADALMEQLEKKRSGPGNQRYTEGFNDALMRFRSMIHSAPTIDAEPVRHGTWRLTAHKESANYGWNVTADCPECGHEKGEIYAAYFPGFPDALARDVLLDNAKSVKMDNFCPNCGLKMDGVVSDE